MTGRGTPFDIEPEIKTIMAWGIGDKFQKNTGTGSTFVNSNLKFIPKSERFRRDGRRKLFNIHRTGPLGFKWVELIPSPLPKVADKAVEGKGKKGKGKKGKGKKGKGKKGKK